MEIVHASPLISTLVIGLTSAFIGGMVASKLRLSPIVGYLLAGLLIGPFTPGFTANTEIARDLSEIGIVLLMFGVGLHFSLQDLLNVKSIALPGAIVQIVVATALGTVITQHWGWPMESGLLFGLALSVASTVVLLRALEEHNALHSINGHIAVGWLIVEDLVIVLALVMIPALAPGFSSEAEAQTGGWLGPLLLALGKICAFVVFMLVAGKRALPWLLNAVARTRSRELFTLAVFVVAVGVAFAAAHLFGISFALGAFFAGMMIKESDLASEVIDKALPFQDAFAVLFFISVGMLFNPVVLIEQPWPVFLVVMIIMVGKSIAAFFIVRMCRYPVHTALLVSASLAQIGEFSFVLGVLGMQYGLLSESNNNLLLAGALISITLNPLMFHAVRAVTGPPQNYPRLARWLNVPGDALSNLSVEQKRALHGHVILVGYGRLGRHIRRHVEAARFNLAMIDLNRERVEAMREKGIRAVAGDASHLEVLQEAAIDQARAIIIAIPNPFEARRIAEAARTLKPDIQVLVRARNDEEIRYFAGQHVSLAVLGAEEVARRMVEHLQDGGIRQS